MASAAAELPSRVSRSTPPRRATKGVPVMESGKDSPEATNTDDQDRPLAAAKVATATEVA